MHVGVLFPMDSVEISFDKPANIWGRAVANHGFLQALADSRYQADTGLQLTVFVPTRQDVQRLQKTLLADAKYAASIVAHIDIPAYLQKSPIDVLHVPAPMLGTAAHIRNFLSERPFVITGVTHSLGNEHFLGWALQNNANGISAGDCLICTTPTARTVVESAFAGLRATQPDFRTPSTRVIPLGIPREAFSADTAVTRHHLGLTDEDFVILSFGRFNHQFKMDVLPLLSLAALLEVQSKRPIRLLLAGSADNGVYAAFVQEQATLNGVGAAVRVLPNIGEAQKASLFRAADVFLSLSDNIQETFGLTVVEALAAGLPVVASDWNGYKALVRHEVTGYLVPTKTLAANAEWEARLSIQPDALTHMYCAQTTAVDLPATCAHLLRLAADRELARAMGLAASASAAPYDWSAIIQRYVELWTELRNAQLKGAATAVLAVKRSSALRFLADFSRYPSSELSLDDRFVTSALGRLVIERKKPLNLYEHMEPVLDLQIMTHVLRLLVTEKSVRNVAGEIHREFNNEPFHVCQNVLWLYKYGFLEHRPAAVQADQRH